MKKKKRLAEANLKDSEEFQDNMCNHRCILNSKVEELEAELEKEKEKNKKAKEFIQENSHEFNCKRDDLIELEFDDNTNATDLIDILDGNW